MDETLFIQITEEFKKDFHRIFLYYGTWEKFAEHVGSDQSWLRRLTEQQYLKEELADKIFTKAGFPHYLVSYDPQPLSIIQKRIGGKVNA